MGQVGQLFSGRTSEHCSGEMTKRSWLEKMRIVLQAVTYDEDEQDKALRLWELTKKYPNASVDQLKRLIEDSPVKPRRPIEDDIGTRAFGKDELRAGKMSGREFKRLNSVFQEEGVWTEDTKEQAIVLTRENVQRAKILLEEIRVAENQRVIKMAEKLGRSVSYMNPSERKKPLISPSSSIMICRSL